MLSLCLQNNNNEDTLRKFEECKCENYGYLIGALYVYKGLLVVFGLFLAYESRNVKYTQINDSRFVSITMYIVVILVGIGAPLSLVLAVHYFIDAAYMLAVLMIIAACMCCLLILYIPKVGLAPLLATWYTSTQGSLHSANLPFAQYPSLWAPFLGLRPPPLA